MNARWHIVDSNRISLILSEIVDFQPTSLMLAGMTLIAIGCHWLLGYHRPSSDIIDARSHIVDFIGRPWFSPERPNGLKATGDRRQNNINKHCGFQFLINTCPWLNQSVNVWCHGPVGAHWGALGPIGPRPQAWTRSASTTSSSFYVLRYLVASSLCHCVLWSRA